MLPVASVFVTSVLIKLSECWRQPVPVRCRAARYGRWTKIAAVAAVLFVGVAGMTTAQDSKPKADAKTESAVEPAADEKAGAAKSASKQRLEIMQKAIDSFRITTKQEVEPPLKFGTSPKLRYDDQVRNLLDAGVWRLGEHGRPEAFVTIELYGSGAGQALLTYEFLALSESQFSMESTNGPLWSPTYTELKFEPLATAPKVSESDKVRLTQLREIARRFVIRQTYRGEKLQLRLLPQPIDRYQDDERKIVDGAAFVFANGTNPELGMLIETDGKAWSYGLFRLSTSAIGVELDGKDVPGIQPNAAYGTNRAYTATRHGVDLPSEVPAGK